MLINLNNRSPYYFEQNEFSEFKNLLENFCSHMEKSNIYLKPYSDNSWNHFRNLSLPIQRAISGHFVKYYCLIQRLEMSGIDLSNSKMLLWSAVKELGFKCHPDLLDLIDDEDVIEIYDSNFLQVFRNFKFMEICSYNILDTLNYSWSELFRRPEKVTQQLVQIGINIFSGVQKNTISINIEDHYLFELFSEELHYFKIHQKYASPLFINNNPAGIVATLRADLLGSHYNKIEFLNKLSKSYEPKALEA